MKFKIEIKYPLTLNPIDKGKVYSHIFFSLRVACSEKGIFFFSSLICFKLFEF